VRQQTINRAAAKRRDPGEPDPEPEPARGVRPTAAVETVLARIGEVLQDS
jgi:hypothetical protein